MLTLPLTADLSYRTTSRMELYPHAPREMKVRKTLDNIHTTTRFGFDRLTASPFYHTAGPPSRQSLVANVFLPHFESCSARGLMLLWSRSVIINWIISDPSSIASSLYFGGQTRIQCCDNVVVSVLQKHRCPMLQSLHPYIFPTENLISTLSTLGFSRTQSLNPASLHP